MILQNLNKTNNMQIDKVKEFHDAFGIKTNQTLSPDIGKKDYELRHRLIIEESDEYLEACKNKDIVEIADALGDQLYIILGTILKHGLQDYMKPVFDEIHSSNMSKLDDKGNKILREDGKILKGKNYFKPEINKILFKNK